MRPAIANSAQCPAPAELQRLLQEELEVAARSRLEEHVEICATCRESLQRLCEDSVLAPLVRTPPSSSTESVRRLLKDLTGRVPVPRCTEVTAIRTELTGKVPEIPGFHQLELIGRGGSGEVYRAWQPALARWVAIKTLPLGRSPEQADRVLREARILGRLSHRHIVQIHDTGELAGHPFLVMEWMAGGSLQERIRRRGLSIREVVQVGHQLAQALCAVHALGIIHRDLKPANVLLQCDGEPSATLSGDPLLAKLTDFSIAMDSTATDRLTLTGQVIGTPHYMAPEQTGLAPHLGAVGPATDIYGLGAILYSALTGQAPYGADGSLAILRAVASGEPRSPRTLRPEIPPDLETIVVKCLRHDPLSRYHSAGELADDLDRYLQGRPISARPYSLHQKLWNWGRQRPLWGAISVTGLVVAGMSLAGWEYYVDRTTQLQSDLNGSQQLIKTTRAQVLDEQRESRRAKWESLRQLTAKTDAMLRSGTLDAEQRRGLLETLRRDYRNRIEDLDPADRELAFDLATGLDQLTAFEERASLCPQVLEDVELLDRLDRKFSPELPLEAHRVQRDMRRTRVLIQLERLDEAAAQLDQLLARDVKRPLGPNLLVVLQGVEYLSEALTARGLFARMLPRLGCALEIVQRHLATHPDDLPIWRGRFEFLARKLRVLDQAQDVAGCEKVEEEWLQFAREFTSRGTPSGLTERMGRLKLMQRITELAMTRSAPFAREQLALWYREIAAFRDLWSEVSKTSEGDPGKSSERTCQAELVAQQMDCLVKWKRLAPPDAPHSPPMLPGYRDALAESHEYLRLNPDDHATRFRLGYSLRDLANYLVSRDALRVCEVAREASDVLAPGAGGGAARADCQQLMSDMLYLSASALRTLGRLQECRMELEQAYLITQGGNRDTIAADLVQVHLALGDRAGAEKAAGWILNEGPQRQEARRLLREVNTAQTPR
ncbi:MAG: protein kinase domain-containing protein [Planctomycetaceae bacterium]